MQIKPLVAALLFSVLLSGCGTPPISSALYDLGPPHTSSAATPDALPPVSIAEVQAPAWLDSQAMYFRLSYTNELQPRPYAGSRWTMAPAALFGQRLKSRIAQAGGVVLPASDGAANIPVLRIEADDFLQAFESPDRSSARVMLRVSLFSGRALTAQKVFSQTARAPTADAAGGVHALTVASDAVIADIIAWLGQFAVKR